MSEKITPGPWGWFGNVKTGSPYLATVHSGRKYIMGFRRLGMRHAQPVFRRDGILVDGKELAIYEVNRDATSADDPSVYRHDIVGFRSADATAIALLPEIVEALKDCVAACGGLRSDNVPESARSVLVKIGEVEPVS